MKTANAVAVTFALILAGGVAVAKDESVAAIKEALSKGPTAEMPAKAADLVFAAKADVRDSMAGDVVKTAIKLKPTVTLAVVGAVCQKSPETAPTVAATAAKSQPKQAKQIAQAAAAAAPAKAAEIVKAVAKVLPKSHREVALAVSQVAPQSATVILASVPESSGSVATDPDVPVVANNNRPPTIGGPFVPISTTPTNVPSGGGVVPEGGRDYATP
jgi:cytochrome c1